MTGTPLRSDRVPGPVHIPLDLRYGRRAEAEDGQQTLFRPRCACGVYGRAVPFVATPDPRMVLAREHGAPEPAGCAVCGTATPPPRRPSDEGDPRDAPWQRYRVIELDGAWGYVCTDEHVCRQRLRAQANGEDPDQGEDPLQWADGQPDHIDTTLDISADSLHGATMREALAHYELARASSPRRWREISQSPADRRALLALVTSASTLAATASDAAWYYILAARKAGASWTDLAAATGQPTAQECRADFCRSRIIDFADVDDPLGRELDTLAQPDADESP
jgi:hypothetical protein